MPASERLPQSKPQPHNFATRPPRSLLSLPVLPLPYTRTRTTLPHFHHSPPQSPHPTPPSPASRAPLSTPAAPPAQAAKDKTRQNRRAAARTAPPENVRLRPCSDNVASGTEPAPAPARADSSKSSNGRFGARPDYEVQRTRTWARTDCGCVDDCLLACLLAGDCSRTESCRAYSQGRAGLGSARVYVCLSIYLSIRVVDAVSGRFAILDSRASRLASAPRAPVWLCAAAFCYNEVGL